MNNFKFFSPIYFCSILAIFLLVSCTSPSQTISDESQSDGWIYLFNGTTTDGWRGYNGDSLPPMWVIVDSVLTFDLERKPDGEYQGGQDIIYAEEEFENFELALEWKIPAGGNSGIFYHVKEGYGAPYEVAPEYQLIDDEGYAQINDLTAYYASQGFLDPSRLNPVHTTGSDYAMYPANAESKILYPPGEWNSSRIVFTPEKVEYWLNEQLTVSFVPWSDEWNERKNAGKWRDVPDYGKFKTGFIGLQDHDSPIWFRNIKIRKL